MKYIDEFRQAPAAKTLSSAIADRATDREMVFMEVCGTHTMSIARYGVRQLLPETISLISGPGCPVCVTPNNTVDHAIALARQPDVILTTFGDMMKVPGSSSSLDLEHARGRDIQVVASTLESIGIAQKNPEKSVVFLGVGFETTAPTVAASLDLARRNKIDNYAVLSAHKVMPPAMEALSRGDIKIDGYICPGHVSAIIGSEPYEFLAKEYGLACVVSGFEPLDVLHSILMLVEQVILEKPSVQVEYKRVVKTSGNPTAKTMLYNVFEPCDSEWRGLGNIPGSGLRIRNEFARWDVEKQIAVDVEPTKEPEGCLCGQVLQGRVKPPQCRHFGKTCTPGHPVGPCMVSTEGTCAAFYKYQID